MTDYVLAGHAKRCAGLAGEADRPHTKLAQIGLGHLDAVIRQFDPDHNLGSIQPRRQRGPDVARPGEMSRFVQDGLRDAAELAPTSEVAARLVALRRTHQAFHSAAT